MLRRTFRIVRGIGPCIERRLWSAGITDWSELNRSALSSGLRQRAAQTLAEAETALAQGDISFFSSRLPGCEQWRLAAEFGDRAAFVDIETTGLDPRRDQITMIGVYAGGRFFTFIQGENLHQFADMIGDYPLIVTYNGKQFDVPFMEKALGFNMSMAHIDLRFVLSALGYRGGLKMIQNQFGFLRPEVVTGLDGRAAIWLWQQFKMHGKLICRDILELYCHEDVGVLPSLLTEAYNMHLKQTPFAHQMLAVDEPIRPDRELDPDIVYQVLSEYSQHIVYG